MTKRLETGRRTIRTTLAGVIAVLCWLTAAEATAQEQFEIYASVADVLGAPVAKLDPGDVRLEENGAQAKVLKVETVSFPVKLQLLLDNGVGLGPENFVHLRNGIRALLEDLPAGIEVTLVVNAGQPRFLVRPTADRDAIMKGVALLSPDGGAGRFVDSLLEATQRIERDKGSYMPVIVCFATTAGDLNVMERDAEILVKRLEVRPTTVHVVLLSLLGTRSSLGGYNQTEIGIGITKMTGGRFEAIAAPSRVATLLPEIGAQIARAHGLQTRQFRITAQRPAGNSGDLGTIRMAVLGGLAVTSVSFDGRVVN